jgi:hypothetical protein
MSANNGANYGANYGANQWCQQWRYENSGEKSIPVGNRT